MPQRICSDCGKQAKQAWLEPMLKLGLVNSVTVFCAGQFVWPKMNTVWISPGKHSGGDGTVLIDVSLVVSPGEHIAVAYERKVGHLMCTLGDVLPVC